MKHIPWLVISFAIIGILAIVTGIYIWQMLGPIDLSFHGWAAIIAGVLGSFLLGGALMALSFYSSRSGHDDKAAEYDPFNRINK